MDEDGGGTGSKVAPPAAGGIAAVAGHHAGGGGHGGGLHANVLVLNKFYLPLHVTSARRAFVLLYKQDAEAVSILREKITSFDFPGWVEHSSRNGDTLVDDEPDYIFTVSLKLRVPRIVRLLKFDRLPIGRVNFSRKNVLARDELRCQYCGHRFPSRDLTLDHVVPRSRGGKHCWTNVVAACYRCNDRKGQHTLREVGMKLLRDPFAPKRSPDLKRKLEEKKYTIWRTFLTN